MAMSKRTDREAEFLSAVAENQPALPGGRVGEALRLVLHEDQADAVRLRELLKGADADLIDGLIDCLSTPYWRESSRLLVMLGPQAVSGIERRTQKSGRVPVGALQVVSQIGGSRSVELALRALKDQEPVVRQAAAEALGDLGYLGDPRVIPALRDLLDDSDRETRCGAALTLGALGDHDSVSVIVRLSQETTEDAQEDFDDLQSAFCALGHLGDAAAVGRLAEAVRDRRVDMAALQGLRVLAAKHPDGFSAVYSQLTDLLDDDRSYVVEEALDVLGISPHPVVVPALAAFLERSGPTHRTAAAAAASILETVETDEATRALARWRAIAQR
jgi:HEAT repeat protein